ncbi:hypothetical protein ACFQDG_01910 [Natronoarchaeum mannanilyticum]|uniref:Uncharacterized protein n=1 Tax=Natronoarchaeum mannanilyticum TaxID=926360 RepID=A0AAV3TBN5_9EURY
MSRTRHDPGTLAQEYLDAVQSEIDEERRRELDNKLEALQDRRKQYVDQHGEDSRFVQRVDQKVEDIELELDELDESAQQTDEYRRQFLEAAVDSFEFNSEWLSTNTLEGLAHALYGGSDAYLVLQQNRIESPDDLVELDEITKLDMEHTLLVLIEDRLGQTDTVSSRWERFADSKYHIPFLVVARDGSASPEDVVPELGGDADRKDAKNWLESPIYDWEDLIPYYRAGDGEFALSTTGKYLYRHYAEDLDDLTGANKERQNETDSDDGGQTSLDDLNGESRGDSDE